jgi:hypothetical protein
VHGCRAKRLLPGPDGHVLFHFPSICYAAAFSRTSLPPCGMVFCLAEDVLSTTELWTRCALAVRCEAFGSYSALSELRLISPEDGLFPWLQISRCSYEGTAPEVALHWGFA